MKPSLAGKCVELAIFPILPPCHFKFDQQGQLESLPLPIFTSETPSVDLKIRFRLQDFILKKKPQIEGEVELALLFESWIHTQPELLEEKLALWFGDYVAQKAMDALSHAQKLSNDWSKRQQSALGEYLKESHVLMPEEVELYARGVDESRLATDRLAARIALLEKHLGSQP